LEGKCAAGRFVPRIRRPFRGTFVSAAIYFLPRENAGTSMNKRQTTKRVQSKRALPRPLMVALAVAIFGVMGMLIVDHGPWNRPKLQTAETVHYATTGAAARAVGATVTPTAPKLEPEPEPPGPKPAQPVNPPPP
jgi:hypothetical protein